MKFRSRLLVIILLCALSLPAMAQDSNLERRLKLAETMHEFRPARDQVDSAILKVAQMKPPAERAAFILAAQKALNYKALEKASVEAMAEVYTLEELEAMVAYYSQPEARSAARKYSAYAAKVQPHITRMLDQALMRARVGGSPQ